MVDQTPSSGVFMLTRAWFHGGKGVGAGRSAPGAVDMVWAVIACSGGGGGIECLSRASSLFKTKPKASFIAKAMSDWMGSGCWGGLAVGGGGLPAMGLCKVCLGVLPLGAGDAVAIFLADHEGFLCGVGGGSSLIVRPICLAACMSMLLQDSVTAHCMVPLRSTVHFRIWWAFHCSMASTIAPMA